VLAFHGSLTLVGEFILESNARVSNFALVCYLMMSVCLGTVGKEEGLFIRKGKHVVSRTFVR